jgi:hypothetical protein
MRVNKPEQRLALTEAGFPAVGTEAFAFFAQEMDLDVRCWISLPVTQIALGLSAHLGKSFFKFFDGGDQRLGHRTRRGHSFIAFEEDGF